MFILCKCKNDIHEEVVVDYGMNHVDAVKHYVEHGGLVDGLFAIYELEPELNEEGFYVYDSDGEQVYKIDRVLRWHINGMDMYLNCYRVELGYGGPEEGGWWYDCGELVESRKVRFKGPCTQAYHEYFDKAREEFINEVEEGEGTHRGKSSAAGGFDIVVDISNTRGPEYFPERKPIYC